MAEDEPKFPWADSVFYLTQVADVIRGDVPKSLRRIFNAEAKVKLPELDRTVRREMVGDAKAVILVEPKINEKILAEGLSKKYGIPTAHVLGYYGIVRQAAKELAEQPDAIAAVRKHLELGGEVVSDFKVLVDLILRGPAKPEVSRGALAAACWQLKEEIEPHVEAAADAIVRKYLDDGGKFAERAKELGPMVMSDMKPEGFNLFVIQGAAFRLIPIHKAELEKKQGGVVDDILRGRIRDAGGGKSGVTIGAALKFQAEGGRPEHRRDRKDHRRGEEDEEGRGGKRRFNK